MNKISRSISYFFLAGILFSYFSCKKEVVTIPTVSYNYFPIKVGTWTEYKVDSVYHSENDNNNDDSVYYFQFYIKEVIDSTYIDNAGKQTELIKRYRRSDTLDVWKLSCVWTQRLSSINAYRTEDNISLHKLSFPINSSITWNVNDANTNDEEIYSYEYFHQPDIFNNLSFDSTLSVLQIDENNYVIKMFGNEIYAAGVGLVFKQRDELGKTNGVVVSGMEYKQVIIAYGN